MSAHGYGRIVNVPTEMTSLADMATGYYSIAPSYRVSKVALNAITLLLGRELHGQNILVNAYSPGWMKTDMGGDSAAFTAEEGAATAVYLATLPDGGPQGGFFAELRKLWADARELVMLDPRLARHDAKVSNHPPAVASAAFAPTPA